MIDTTAQRKAQSTERLSHRSTANTLRAVIEQGTNCSPFEAEIISEKALEILRVGPHARENELQPGQMMWRAIEEGEPAGKPLAHCKFKTIRLTVHSLEEDLVVLHKAGRSTKRGQQILRMTQEALDQGALLTQEDLAVILDSDVKTIRTDIHRLQKAYELLVPTRGTRKDIGPGVTHRDKVTELYLRGTDAVQIARDMKHSLKAVERYIRTFSRVVYTQSALHNTLKTALVTGVSIGVVERCLDLKERYRTEGFYRERLAEIEQEGRLFWEAQGFKKKRGRMKRRTT